MSEQPSFCSKCGEKLPEGVSFCPKCGMSVSGPSAPVAPRRGEKSEKGEKAEKPEKPEKPEKHEKPEKKGDALGAVTGGLVLVWLGISFLVAHQFPYMFREWWHLFLIGLGLILIIQGIIRIGKLRYRGSGWGSIVGGSILLVIGLVSAGGITEYWWLIFIAIGIVIIAGAWRAQRASPRP